MEAKMDELKKLRRRIAEERRQGCGKGGKRYSEALRRDVSTYLRAARAKGGSPNQLGPALGLSLPTAYQWSATAHRRWEKPQAFRQMSIVAQPATGTNTSTATSPIVVTGPGGLRATGLGISDLAELLRRLGC
jgi:hypothetical protein